MGSLPPFSKVIKQGAAVQQACDAAPWGADGVWLSLTQIPMGPEQCGAGGSWGLFLLADPSPASLQPSFLQAPVTSKAGQELGSKGRKSEEPVQAVKLLAKALSHTYVCSAF